MEYFGFPLSFSLANCKGRGEKSERTTFLLLAHTKVFGLQKNSRFWGHKFLQSFSVWRKKSEIVVVSRLTNCSRFECFRFKPLLRREDISPSAVCLAGVRAKFVSSPVFYGELVCFINFEFPKLSRRIFWNVSYICDKILALSFLPRSRDSS